MYPELYQKWFKLALNPTELVLIEILMKIVGLLSKATLGHLATWLLEIDWGYCLRLKKNTYICLDNDELVTLNQLAYHPGVKIFLQGVNISKTAHKFPFNVAIHYLDANIMVCQ